MAVYAIGDLQGCHDEFQALLERLAFDPAADRVWLTGDLVNRGPGSLAALRAVRALGASATVVLGNHDLHLLAVAHASGRNARRGDTLAEVLAATDRDELLAWLAGLPLLHVDRALGWAMVHAGLPPQWDLAAAAEHAAEVEQALRAAPGEFLREMYGDQPARWSERLAAGERRRFTVNALTRLRFCGPGGELLLKLKGPPQSAPAGALPWFRMPGRRSAGERILFGHWSALGYYAGEGVVSLDSGCVWGGALTAVRLDAPAPPVQLECRGALAAGVPENY